MAKLKKRQRKLLIQFIEYCVSGGAYFWSGYLIFFLADKGLHWNLWWAKLSANVVGWIVNYTLQRYWVFNNKGLKGHQTQVTGRYAVITIVDFILDYLIVAGLKNFGISPYLGQFASAGFFTFWNYLWYRFWVFPEKFTKKVRVHTVRVAHRPHGHTAYRRA
jgi:putative flippase GtrA